MPAKKNVNALLRKHLGKEVGDELIRKIDTMAKSGATPAKIQKAISADLVAHVQKQVAISVIAKAGPLVPIKVTTVKSNARIGSVTTVKNIPKIQVNVVKVPAVSIKTGPGPLTRGAKK